MKSLFILISLIRDFDLGSIVKSIVFPFLFAYFAIRSLIDFLIECYEICVTFINSIQSDLFALLSIFYDFFSHNQINANLNFNVIKLPKPMQSPLFTINEQLQSLTVKNLKSIRSFPSKYRKQDMIDTLLIIC